MDECKGKYGHEFPCFGRGNCHKPGCYRNRRINLGLGDKTWKERHAKGVPVIMRTEDWIRFDHTLLPDHHYWSLKTATGEVYVRVDWPQDMPFGELPPMGARFCNFRYKPEWVEKHKKQTI